MTQRSLTGFCGKAIGGGRRLRVRKRHKPVASGLLIQKITLLYDFQDWWEGGPKQSPLDIAIGFLEQELADIGH